MKLSRLGTKPIRQALLTAILPALIARDKILAAMLTLPLPPVRTSDAGRLSRLLIARGKRMVVTAILS